MRLYALALLVLSASCCRPTTPTGSAGAASTHVTVANHQAAGTTVYVAFGSDSAITASDWSAFCAGSGLTCSFPIAAGGVQPLPTDGRYLNATLSFGAPVTCGITKAEVNVNNPAWFDTFDVSLVDGYSNKVRMVYAPPAGVDAGVQMAGPPAGASGNESVLGIFPYGCDICVARQAPPCGIPTGSDGCKTGTQSNPAVPCQLQGAVKGGGGTLAVSLEP